MGAVLDWARSKKADMVQFQADFGVPALAAISQFCHESASGDGLSQLARVCHNYGGLKWSEWQQPYGCVPVKMGTWEEVSGTAVTMDALFCRCPDWPTWLKVYGALLTGNYYGDLRQYAQDPLLYISQVAARGYATDSAYLGKVVGWMVQLWPDYADTLPTREPVSVRVMLPDATEMVGELRGDTTWAPLRGAVESLNGRVRWDENGPCVVVERK